MATPLEGIRVLDFTQVASGPMCTQILGDLGAEVWKIERPNVGDVARTGIPFKGGECSYYHSFDRNKKCVTLDFTKAEGKAIVMKMLMECDVVVENFGPGTLGKYGLDYAALSQEKPDIVMASVSGFGQQDSPYVHKLAYDGMVQAMCGLMSLTGYPDQLPVKVGPAVIDLISGYYATIGIVSALYERKTSGLGQYLDIAMMDCGIASLEQNVAHYTFSGASPVRLGNAHSTVGCTNSYETSDGSLYISCSSNAIAMRIADAIGHPELKEDSRFASNADRAVNRDFIDVLINTWTSQRTRAEIIGVFDEAHIPCGPVNTIEDMVKDPHTTQRGMLYSFEHPKAGTITVAGSPLRFSRTPVREPVMAAALGANNQEIYGDALGISSAKLGELEKNGII